MTLGHRRGPVTKDEFCDKIAKQEVFIDSTQVWKQGMTQWVNLAESKAFAADIKKIRSAASQADARVREETAVKDMDEDISCRGVSRALFNLFFYVGWLVPMMIGIVVLTELQVQQYLDPARYRTSVLLQLVPSILLMIAMWQMAASRMQHAGYSKAHGLGVFVPIYNLWVFLVCLFAPRNYSRRKKLGAAAFVYLFLMLGGLAASALIVVPKVGATSLSPLALTEGLTDFYKEKTNYTGRYNTNVAEAASSEARQEQMKKQKELQKQNSRGSLRRDTQ
ncbi:DUF4339 domain-containing protein [Rubritalea tangerina]|uniref:DUF4339 domain-containing protein n=1 Tax=Rubritalea tangerina TaxID=430798 RepID=UPI003621ADBB